MSIQACTVEHVHRIAAFDIQLRLWFGPRWTSQCTDTAAKRSTDEEVKCYLLAVAIENEWCQHSTVIAAEDRAKLRVEHHLIYNAGDCLCRAFDGTCSEAVLDTVTHGAACGVADYLAQRRGYTPHEDGRTHGLRRCLQDRRGDDVSTDFVVVSGQPVLFRSFPRSIDFHG